MTLHKSLHHPVSNCFIPWPGEHHAQETYVHAAKRLEERYGISISLEEYQELCETLWQKPAPILDYTDKGRVTIRIKVQGSRVTAIWNPATGIILTFLPSHAWGTTKKKVHEYRKSKQGRKNLVENYGFAHD